MIFQEIKKDKYFVEFVINNRRYAVLIDDLKHAIKEVEIWQSYGGVKLYNKIIRTNCKSR